jgi:hypothetical protein
MDYSDLLFQPDESNAFFEYIQNIRRAYQIPSQTIDINYNCGQDITALENALNCLSNSSQCNQISHINLRNIKTQSAHLDLILTTWLKAFQTHADPHKGHHVKNSQWFISLQKKAPVYLQYEKLFFKLAKEHTRLTQFSIHRIAHLRHHLKSHFLSEDASILFRLIADCAETLHHLSNTASQVLTFVSLQFDSNHIPILTL